MRSSVIAVIVVIAIGLGAAEARGGENLWRSVLVPGWGQLEAGHYGRGSLFLSGELVSLAALMMSDIQYRRAVEQYDRAKASYLNARYIGDAVREYGVMNEKWDDAEKLDGYRRTAAAAAIGVWVVNVVDILLFDEREEPLLSLDQVPGGFIVTRRFSF